MVRSRYAWYSATYSTASSAECTGAVHTKATATIVVTKTHGDVPMVVEFRF
jgi:hypothetical protein